MASDGATSTTTSWRKPSRRERRRTIATKIYIGLRVKGTTTCLSTMATMRS
ncbi:Protein BRASSINAZOLE-RESISTANT 1 [Sesbania bispinosa]|nr:Protein BRASSINAZOLE-RESISTANT 1 [Sesbania bispinosa]